MAYESADWDVPEEEERPADPSQAAAARELSAYFEANPEKVFFSRQLEVLFERTYFHWVTNRAIHQLEAERKITSEMRRLRTGGEVKLIWNRAYRYYRRAAVEVVRLIEAYADPNIGGALGLHGEMLVLEAFARNQFVLRGRSVRELDGFAWKESEHNLDLVFQRDGVTYGIEVKNTLSYIDYREFRIKIRLCKTLGLRPVFAVRMLPKTWIEELWREGGYAMILQYQLYPWSHQELARRVRTEFGLPVDAPRAIFQGTMDRFLRFHARWL